MASQVDNRIRMFARDLSAELDKEQEDEFILHGPRQLPEPPQEELPPADAYKDDEPIGLDDTDIANAVRFALQHGADVRFTPERGWFVWDGKRWQVDDKAILVQQFAKLTALAIFDEVKSAHDRNAMFSHAKRSQSKRAIEAMLWLARSEPGIPARLTDFDANGWLLNVENGTVDLKTAEVRPHNRADMISNLVGIPYVADATCELWDAFLWRILDGNEELYRYLKRFVGYLLVADTSDQSVHFLHGTGANGKSVFCEVLQRLLGDYAIVVSPDLLMLKRHGGIPNDVARLRGIRAALMNETTQGGRFDEAKLKDLTGGDSLTARFLHQEFFDFRPTHRLILRGNHRPSVAGTDEGIWRRLRLVPFTVSIPPDEQDRDLLRKLESELPGILQWALTGCIEWQREGLKPPSIVTDAVRAYREDSDILGRFIEECCQVKKLGQVKSSVFFQRYQQYAHTAGERWLSSKDLPNEMHRRGFEWKRTNQGGVFMGLQLSDNDFPDWRNRE